MVSIPIKTGTIPELNHISAKSISEITGVERIVTKTGLINALNPLLIPATIPTLIPKIAEITKPIEPLTIVAPATNKKSLLPISLITVKKVSSGWGTINDELKYSANIFQTAKIDKTEANPI
jgi:hypothetical protein